MAGDGWRESALGDFTRLQRQHDLTVAERRAGKVPVMGSAGISGYHDTALARGPGVTIGRSGVGSMGVVSYSPVDFWPHNTVLYVTDFPGNDQRFTYYFLKQLNLRRFNSGSAQASLNRNHIYPLRIRVPEPRQQRAIAHILGTLDDKIELNRRMNETLEAMARALFKSWFVDFDPVRAKLEGRPPAGLDAATAALFPDTFQDSSLGKIPVGWRVAGVGDEFRLTMGQSPPGSTYNESGFGVPFFQGRRDFGFRYPSRRVYCTAPTRFAEADDTLVSVRAPVGDLNMAIEGCAIGRGVAAVRHKTKSRSYTCYAMHDLAEEFARYEAEGTVFGCINKEDFAALEIVAASDSIVDAFERLVNPCDQAIETGTWESKQLATLRDALLPKLLSGEMRVCDAERRVEGGT